MNYYLAEIMFSEILDKESQLSRWETIYRLVLADDEALAMIATEKWSKETYSSSKYRIENIIVFQTIH